MRELPKSTTTIWPSGVMQTPEGVSISPGPLPSVPNFFRKTPEDEKT
jgi:hypothetical protein